MGQSKDQADTRNEDMHILHDDGEFVGDMYADRPFNRQMATGARNLEIDSFCKMGVYTKVGRNSAHARIIAHR